MTGRPSASVVVCAYTEDRWPRLVAAVESVLAQEPPAAETILVADHCPSLERRAQDLWGGRGVRVVPNTGPQGLSAARNTGITVAGGDVVAFLDDDAVAQPGWLARHLVHYADPRVVGVGGRIEPLWEATEPDWFPREFGWVVGCSYVGLPDVPTTVRNPIGANMSFRRDVVERVGGFAESLGRVGTATQGCEETELSIRATRAVPGGRILYDPTAAVHHVVPPARGRWSYFRQRCWSEGRSKAQVSRLAGATSGLSAERVYVRRTLPRGVARHLATAARERDLEHAARAVAIVAGLTFTAAGYVTALSTRGHGREPELT